MKKNILYSFLIIAFSFCASSSNLPNDVRWVVNSSEYEKLCRQIYSQAIKDIAKIFIDGNSAIIMDLDETALDNSQYQIELYDKGKSFSMESWSKWVIRAEAKLVPGAKEFFDYIRKMNIQIIFISNRMNERLASTIRNMKKTGIYNEKDIYLLRLDKQDKKENAAKAWVNSKFQVLELFSLLNTMSTDDEKKLSYKLLKYSKSESEWSAAHLKLE